MPSRGKPQGRRAGKREPRKAKRTQKASARQRGGSPSPARPTVDKTAKPGARNKRSRRKLASTHARSRQVLRDMQRDSSLTLTRAARKRKINPRTVRAQLPAAFYRDSSGRINARSNDPVRQTLYIPSKKPGQPTPVPTKHRRERKLLGQWMTALNAAGRHDWRLMRAFPPGQIVGGVRLPTSPYEVQQILRALAEEEAPFEGLYRTIARPS